MHPRPEPFSPDDSKPDTGTTTLDRLRILDSCAVSDALDSLGLPGAVTGVNALWQVGETVAGRVRTVQAGPRPPDSTGEHIAAAAIESADSEHVLVIANGGRTDVSCFGGILAEAASRRRIRGVVIDGACRDIGESETLGFPVFGRAVVPVSARGRIVQLEMGGQVQFAGVQVDEGDLVIADRNGVAFVPSAFTDRIIALAERIILRENAMAEAVRAGRAVTEVMHDSRFPSASEETL